MSKKYFTLQEANALIPILEFEVQALQTLQENFQNKLTYLKYLKEKMLETETIFLIESELEFLEMQAELHVRNIKETGAELKGIEMGLLDFPAFVDNEEVLLCWRLGEKEITHYHGEHEGFQGRKPL